MGELVRRDATDADSAAVITLIGGCFAEYPGCVLDLPGIDAWMQAPASAYA
nr:GNAT family N-acetyltransferase [Geodermatophilaceae bacterium]